MPVRALDAPAVDPRQRGISDTFNQTAAAVPDRSSSSTQSTTSSSRPSTATSVVESSPSDQPQSFAQRVVQQQSGPALGFEHDMQDASSQGDIGMRDIERGAPGDPIGRRKSQLNPDVQKRQNAYFENSFAATNRDPESVRTRQEQNALVMAEFRTNVIVSRYLTTTLAECEPRLKLLPVLMDAPGAGMRESPARAHSVTGPRLTTNAD